MACSTLPSCGDSVARRMTLPWRRANLVTFLGVAAAALALDQLTKLWVVAHIAPGASRALGLGGHFYLTHVTNPGAAFSLFASTPALFRAIFFPLLGCVALVLVVSLYRGLREKDLLSACALGGILGGALGNLCDRAFRGGAVVDFLHLQLTRTYAWPDFNFADSFIVAGVALLAWTLLVRDARLRETP